MFKKNAANHDGDEQDKIDPSDVMHELGAPWSWMFEFVEHNSAKKSYNFIEIGEIELPSVPNGTMVDADFRVQDVDTDLAHAGSLIDRDAIQVDADVPAMPGIGKPIKPGDVHDFLNFLRYRSIDENGMVFPRHFKEADCPKMN